MQLYFTQSLMCTFDVSCVRGSVERILIMNNTSNEQIIIQNRLETYETTYGTNWLPVRLIVAYRFASSTTIIREYKAASGQ